MGFTCSKHEVCRTVLLEHQPHPLHVFRRVSPVAARVEVPQKELLLAPGNKSGHGTRDLARHKGFPAPWRLVIEHNTIAGKESITLPVIVGHPVGINLCRGIWAARAKGCTFVLRCWCITKHLTT